MIMLVLLDILKVAGVGVMDTGLVAQPGQGRIVPEASLDRGR
jgi:hypothetical protein